MSNSQKIVVTILVVIVIGSFLFGLYMFAGSLIKNSYSSMDLVSVETSGEEPDEVVDKGKSVGFVDYAATRLGKDLFPKYQEALSNISSNLRHYNKLIPQKDVGPATEEYTFKDNVNCSELKGVVSLELMVLYTTPEYIVCSCNSMENKVQLVYIEGDFAGIAKSLKVVLDIDRCIISETNNSTVILAMQ